MKNADMPAMPVLYAPNQHGGMERCGTNGLTKREAFAMAAMQGLCVSSGRYSTPQDMAHAAVKAADALLAALEESNER